MNNKETASSIAFGVINDYKTAELKLITIPSILHTFINAYNIDSAKLTEMEMLDLALHHDILNDVLSLIIQIIYDFEEADGKIEEKWRDYTKNNSADAHTTEPTI